MMTRILNLLKAYKIVEQEEPNAQLIVMGTGNYEREARKLAKELKLKDAYFPGHISEGRI
ncbi:MAG: hypothetical protein DRJ59_06060 [Thermoprotei archaeon]|nr:MAG: hypothetical protein DRJ59_06060 [Thermoprotei archaeon]